MALTSGKNEVKCIPGPWLLQTQASLEGDCSFSFCLFNKNLLASVGPDLHRPVVISISETMLELEIAWRYDSLCFVEHLDTCWTGLML